MITSDCRRSPADSPSFTRDVLQEKFSHVPIRTRGNVSGVLFRVDAIVPTAIVSQRDGGIRRAGAHGADPHAIDPNEPGRPSLQHVPLGIQCTTRRRD